MTAPTRSKPRIPLNTLAIAFGMAGLATVWTTAARALGWTEVVSIVLWIVAAVTWLWLIAAHTVRGSRSADALSSQLRHPAQGPIAAIVPAVGMILGSELYLVWPLGGALVALISGAAATLFAGWILAFWHTGHLNPEAFHGAYLLPTVATPLIASTVAARLGLPQLALGAFGVGVFFWVVLVTVLLSRLAFFPPLPDPLTPTLAILLAPPAVAGTAWFAMNGLRDDPVSLGLLGMLVLMAVVQLYLVAVYRRLPFSLGFWSFTFPVASAASYTIDWLEIAAFPGWQWLVVAAAIVATAPIVAVGVRSLMLLRSGWIAVRRAEQLLRHADDSAERGSRPGAGVSGRT